MIIFRNIVNKLRILYYLNKWFGGIEFIFNCSIIMAEQRKSMTVGLFKKSEDNKIEDYIEMIPDVMMNLGPDIGKDF